MNQHSSDSVEKSQKKKLIILIVGIVVLALALGAVGTLWYMKQTERTKAARKQCEIKVAQISKAKAVWKSLVHNSVITDLTKGDSDNAKELAKIMSEKVPDAVSCTANSPEELGSQSVEALAASEWYAVKAKRVRELAVTLIDENNKKDKDKDKQDEETKKQEINESTGIVIQRSNVVPPKPKPTPAPTTNTQDTKKQKTEKNKNKDKDKNKDKNKDKEKEQEKNKEKDKDTKGSEDGSGDGNHKGNDGQEDPNDKAKKGDQDPSAKADLIGPPPSSESPQKP
ncbi:ATPase [Gardnerella sp. DNF01162]|uniref:ATPase n=1 Tax=Gardnerella TaxID=2701 RepID=UPI000C9C3A8A|nr:MULTISPECIES: ATPase [Gardnerella]NSX39275.1 ATPase [Gardnerella vaginalis]PMC44085.1 ATPase [Gardnerella vaginalis]PNP91690.1 ATPase [Gardnerella sp. DNF01162]